MAWEGRGPGTDPGLPSPEQPVGLGEAWSREDMRMALPGSMVVSLHLWLLTPSRCSGTIGRPGGCDH